LENLTFFWSISRLLKNKGSARPGTQADRSAFSESLTGPSCEGPSPWTRHSKVHRPSPPPTGRPHYVDGWGRLEFRGEPLCTLRKAGSFERLILAEFERRGWPKAIADPLPHDPTDPPDVIRERLYQAVRRINAKLPPGTIRFRADGRRVWWQRCGETIHRN
jgi:hypothetical protein